MFCRRENALNVVMLRNFVGIKRSKFLRVSSLISSAPKQVVQIVVRRGRFVRVLTVTLYYSSDAIWIINLYDK